MFPVLPVKIGVLFSGCASGRSDAEAGLAKMVARGLGELGRFGEPSIVVYALRRTRIEGILIQRRGKEQELAST